MDNKYIDNPAAYLIINSLSNFHNVGNSSFFLHLDDFIANLVQRITANIPSVLLESV